MDYERHYEQYRAAVEDYLSALFAGSAPYDRLYDAMRYSVLSGGKRIRPVLTLEFARLGGIDWRLALPYACALAKPVVEIDESILSDSSAEEDDIEE